MKTLLDLRRIVLAGLLLVLAAKVHAQVYVLNFTGTLDTEGQTLFGESGSAVPFSFSLTIDPALNTSTVWVPAGTQVTPNDLLAVNYVGYSASSIVASSLTFGTQTWTKLDLKPNDPGAGNEADFFLNSGPAITAPVFSWIQFSVPADGEAPGKRSDNSLELGWSVGDGLTTTMESQVLLADALADLSISGAMTTSVSAVPEPSTYAALAGVAALGLAWWRRREASAS